MKAILLLVIQFLLFPALIYAQQSNIHPEILAVLNEIKNFKDQERKTDSVNQQVLGSNTESTYLKQYIFYKKTNAKLITISKNALSFEDQINLELLQHDLLDKLAAYEFKSYLNPILSDYGFHTGLPGLANVNLKSNKDAEHYLIQLKDIPRFVDEHLSLMRKGLTMGISQPKVILNGYENTYTQHIVDAVEQTIFWKPFRTKPTGISEPDWQSFQVRAKAIIQKDVTGSYRKNQNIF